MSKHTDAADAIRRMAKQYEQMVLAAELLDDIGSSDNAAKEARAAAVAAQAETAAAKADLAKAKDAVKDAKAKAEDIIADAKAKADGIVADATGKALVLTNESISKIEAVRVSVKAGMDADAKAAHDRADVLAGLIAERQKAVDALNEKVADAEARLDKAEKQMSSMKAKLASLVD